MRTRHRLFGSRRLATFSCLVVVIVFTARVGVGLLVPAGLPASGQACEFESLDPTEVLESDGCLDVDEVAHSEATLRVATRLWLTTCADRTRTFATSLFLRPPLVRGPPA